MPGAKAMKFRYWYAPGVGAVKWTYEGGQVILKSFSEGEKK